MIVEAILAVLFSGADILLGFIPVIEWTVDTSAWTYARDIMSMIAYMLPMGHIKAVIALLVSVTLFRIAVSLIRFLTSIIPGL